MLLNLDVREQIRSIVDKEFKERVKLVLFSQLINCDSCQTTEELLRELVEVVGEDRLSLEIHSPSLERDLAQRYKVDRVPTIVVEGDKDYGIRYVGLPAGLEFSTLFQAILDVSRRKPRLSEKTLEALKQIDKEIDIMVFVTTSCGYCPSAAITAINFALASDYIKAKVIDASENPDLANRFAVVGVPKIVINEGLVDFVGAQPESAFLGYILSAYNLLSKES